MRWEESGRRLESRTVHFGFTHSTGLQEMMNEKSSRLHRLCSPPSAAALAARGQSEVANGLVFHHPSVCLIETAQGSEVVATEYSVSSSPARTAAAMADGPTKGWIGMQPTEKKAAKSPLTRLRQPQDDRKTKNELTERQR